MITEKGLLSTSLGNTLINLVKWLIFNLMIHEWA